MRIFRHFESTPREARGGVVALGNFDGVHRGHRAVIEEARGVARRLGAPLQVMTFEPHPRAFFKPEAPPFRLTPFRIKARDIEALGVDHLFMQHFDERFAALSAETFVDDVLVAGLGVRHVVTGYDYVFGSGRRGTVAFLDEAAQARGFGFTCVPPAGEEHGPVWSSSRIREALEAGRPGDAARMLGHFWEIEGRVRRGDARGHQLGFPTANLGLDDYLRPAGGVYAVRAGVDHGPETTWHDGVANLGTRPTVDGAGEPVLEVHLFDTGTDLYGAHLRVQFITHLRPEKRFSGLEELKATIAADCEMARRVLAETAR